MSPQAKSREDTIRRVAQRRGFALRKSRRRDPLALDYGRLELVNLSTDTVVTAFASIDEAEVFFANPDNWRNQ